MWFRLQVWLEIHDYQHHVENVWTVAFGGLMVLWPVLLYAAGVNVFTSAWYWLTYLI